MIPPVLYVTSFNPELYAVSAHELLDSFIRVGQVGPLLCCYEGAKPARPEPNFQWHNLDTDPFLQDWLVANRDVIPEHLGGTTKMCDCPNATQRHATHKKGCYWQWMNRNASRWFRKVASLRHAARQGSPYVIWLDADVVLKQAIPSQYLSDRLQRLGVLCFRGHRPAVEAGLVGFNLKTGGQIFIEKLCQRYTSRDYLKYERWDDGYQMAMLLDEKACRFRDLVHPTKHKAGRLKTNNVIPTTQFVRYIDHRKGRHGTGLGIMQ